MNCLEMAKKAVHIHSKTLEEGALNMLQYPARRRRQTRHSIFHSKTRAEEALICRLKTRAEESYNVIYVTFRVPLKTQSDY